MLKRHYFKKIKFPPLHRFVSQFLKQPQVAVKLDDVTLYIAKKKGRLSNKGYTRALYGTSSSDHQCILLAFLQWSDVEGKASFTGGTNKLGFGGRKHTLYTLTKMRLDSLRKVYGCSFYTISIERLYAVHGLVALNFLLG